MRKKQETSIGNTKQDAYKTKKVREKRLACLQRNKVAIIYKMI